MFCFECVAAIRTAMVPMKRKALKRWISEGALAFR